MGEQTQFSKVAEIYRYRADFDISYTVFHINFHTQQWVGGLSVCGETRRGIPAEKTLFRVDRVGGYVVYSTVCGGRTGWHNGKAQVAFEENGRKPVYLRVVTNFADQTEPNGWRPAPMQTELNNLTCVAPGFTPSRLEILGKFNYLSHYVRAYGRESPTLYSFLEKARALRPT